MKKSIAVSLIVLGSVWLMTPFSMHSVAMELAPEKKAALVAPFNLSTPSVSVQPQVLPGNIYYLQDPLLVYVGLSNQAARNVTSRNQQRHEMQQALDELPFVLEQQRPDVEPIESVPKFVLGSDDEPVEALLAVNLLNAQGELVLANIPGLATNQADIKSVTLDEKTTLGMHFGIKTQQLSLLAPGQYQLQVVLDTRRATTPMWRGRQTMMSSPFELRADMYESSGMLINARHYLAALYYQQDSQSEQVKRYANKILERNSGTFEHHAWSLLGDVAMQAGDKTLAIANYDKALSAYEERQVSALAQSQADFSGTTTPMPVIEAMQHIYQKLAYVRGTDTLRIK